MYTVKNYKTKKALKLAVAEGETVRLQPNFIGNTPTEGKVFIEGPHGVHTWYAEAILVNGVILSVR